MKGLLLYTLLLATSLLDYAKVTVTAQQFNEPEGQRRDQTYRVVEFENSGIDQSYDGYLSYDCTFRGKWSQARHPREFPTRASWSMPVMVSHSNAWRFWTGTEAVRTGAESVAEEGFITKLTNDFMAAGFATLQLVVGQRMFNTTESQHLPPINVTSDSSFLSSMVRMDPSPDWFVGFSDFPTISPDTETFYERFVLESYIWDAGTDEGETYTATDSDPLQNDVVKQFIAQTENVPAGYRSIPLDGIFLAPSSTCIPVPAEFECVLRIGEQNKDESDDLRPPLYVEREDACFDQSNDADGGNGGSGAMMLVTVSTTIKLGVVLGLSTLFFLV